MRTLQLQYKLLLTSTIFLLIHVSTIAQNTNNSGHIQGKVIDAKSNQPVGFSSAALFKMPNDSLVAGVLVSDNGEFSFDNVAFGKYRLKIKFIGYKDTALTVLVIPGKNEINLGDIKFESNTTELKAVEVVAEKQSITLSVDKKTFNVDKDLSVKGGTGIDAVKNVPGVSVDADGSVSLRNNSNVQVFIDGKQTSLTLSQIPADQIESIEVITNPSAKYDANTSGGILNVVLKKNSKPNYNGSIIGGIGTNNRYNGAINVNAKNNVFNVSASYNYNTEENLIKAYTIRENITNYVPIKNFEQHGLTDAKRTNQMARLSLDYYVNKMNTVSVGGNMIQGDYLSTDDQHYTSKDSSDNTYSYGQRVNNNKNTFTNYVYQLNHKKTFLKPGKEWTTALQYTSGKSKGGNLFTTNDTTVAITSPGPALQNNDVSGVNNLFTFQSDFTNPINDSTKIEFGIKTVYKQNHNINTTTNYSYVTNAYVYDSVFSNDYLINDLVNAAYVNYTKRIKKTTFQGGLRFEDSFYQGKVLNKTGQDFGYSYPSSASTIMKSLFPALYLSRKVNAKNEFQFNVSRKINRPNFFQMLPIVMASDNFNYRTGNPRLQPEFVNKAEINYNYTKQNINYLTSFYGQYTENAIVFVSYQSPTNPNLLINTFKNGKGNYSYGWENILRLTVIKMITITATATPYYIAINYTNEKGDQLQSTGFSFNSKLVFTLRLPKDFTFQANGTYEAPKPLPQGNNTDLKFFDLSLNKSIKQHLYFNLILSDVLNSKQRGSNYNTPDYTQRLMNRREARYLKLTVTYTFGKDTAPAKKKTSKPGDSNSDMEGL